MSKQRTDLLLGMVLQVTSDQVKQVLQETRGKLTPEEGRALVNKALRERDQADCDKWQVLQHHLLFFPGFGDVLIPCKAVGYAACVSGMTCCCICVVASCRLGSQLHH